MNTTTFLGNEVKLIGTQVGVGDNAPLVEAVGADLKAVAIGGLKDKVQLIITVPSLDTDTCAAETRRFNVEVSKLNMCETTIVSMDLPFAAKRFCTTEGIENLSVASDFIAKDVSMAYGVLMDTSVLRGLSARAIFVVDKTGKIVYKEIVPEVTEEPNYEAAIQAIKDAQ